jgi:hypothetical protein
MKEACPVLVCFLALCLVKGCFFTDNSFYEVDPLAGDPPEVSVITNLDTVDLPRVNDSLQVIYDLHIENGEFFFMEALISGEVVFASDSSHGSFMIYPFQSQATGIDSLAMEFYHSSNTNSLADLAGYEARITRLKFAIDFNQGSP